MAISHRNFNLQLNEKFDNDEDRKIAAYNILSIFPCSIILWCLYYMMRSRYSFCSMYTVILLLAYIVEVMYSLLYSTLFHSNKFFHSTGSSPPQNFTVNVLSSTEVELSWEYPESPNGEIQGYSILSAEPPAIEQVIMNITLDMVNDNSDQTVVVTDLTPFTRYSFRVRAFSFGDQMERPNFVHIGIASNEIIVRTDEDGKMLTFVCSLLNYHFVQFLRLLQTSMPQLLPQLWCTCHGVYLMLPMGSYYITLWCIITLLTL